MHYSELQKLILSSTQVKSFYFPVTSVELRIQQKNRKKKKLRIIFWSTCLFLPTARERWADFYLEYLRWVQLFTNFISSLLTQFKVIRNIKSKSMACTCGKISSCHFWEIIGFSKSPKNYDIIFLITSTCVRRLFFSVLNRQFYILFTLIILIC